MAGFMSGSAAMTVYGGVGSDFDADALMKFVFSESITPDNRRQGWVGLGNALDLDFDFGLEQKGFAGFSFRLDSRSVSSGAVAIQLAELVREKEVAGEKISGKAKKDLKETITAKLLSQAPFVPALVDCLWDLEHGRLFISSTAEKTLLAVTSLFQTTFGAMPQPLAAKKDITAIFAQICRNGEFESGSFRLAPFGSASLSTAMQQEEKSQIAVQNNLAAIVSALDEGLIIQKLRLLASVPR